MSNPDPRQRTVLGWQIRWIAGLFSLLMVAAGSIPAFATESVELLPDARGVALFETAHDEQASPPELSPATGEFLGAGSGPTWETELEKEGTETSVLVASLKLPCVPDARLTTPFDDRAPRASDAAGRLSTRAPPLA